jgi:uncharacterized membrane protein YeaQ/YmgE (transglycosylase-associated protein family)
MSIMVWIVPGLLSGMIAKKPAGWRRGPPGLIHIGWLRSLFSLPAWLTTIVGAAILLVAYCLSGSRTAHVAAAGVGRTELRPLA